MKVTQAEIVISAVSPEQYPKLPLPEIALAGRSNVGKSSLINTLINRKNLARTSSNPGKTQTLNFYLINEIMHFVDLPGYGYARVSKTTREKWGTMIETYLTQRQQLKAVFLIIDLRHPPTADDKLMYDWLVYYEIPHQVIATKHDKVPRSKVPAHVKTIRQRLGLPGDQTPLLFSSETGMGKDQLWKTIIQLCELK